VGICPYAQKIHSLLTSALVVLVGLLVAACGLPFYQMQNPDGSPPTRILQVQDHLALKSILVVQKAHVILYYSLPPFQITDHFSFSRYIAFKVYLVYTILRYIAKVMYLGKQNE
jgi:hypothetical protein